MSTYHGFELTRDERIAELNTQARVYRHRQTGAELLSLENDDENKVFGVAFCTPPADSTGIAHILEHAVLGGSHKYPLKEPFIQLVKGSLKTFLNAMTYPDRTVYPVASQNLKDFYNLVEVYLDAVFFPLITPHHLEQEGWHYEVDGPDGDLSYKGVVFNEMKGAYSSPDNLLDRLSQQSLFPDTTYGFDSGGDPRVIPQLTYAQFRSFHETYYHPSNARLFFYGDDDPMERLRLLDAVLSRFNGAPASTRIPLQSLFAAPRRSVQPYGVNAGADAGKKGLAQVNWLLPENGDQALSMGLSVLSYALVSTQASPLRKALIDSGLGEELTGGGLDSSLRQMTFSVGLKGIEPGDTGKMEALILDTLAQLAETGFEADMVEATLNTFEFALRENNTGSSPRGLRLLMRSLRTWLYGHDPLGPLAYETPLATVRQLLATDQAYLQALIRAHLLDNPHRTTVTLEPDPDFNRRLEDEERARLAEARVGMSASQVEAVAQNARELRHMQETPDSPELLAKLPTLGLADLDRQIKTIPLTMSQAHGSRILHHDLFTNGIVYLDAGFDLHAVSADLLPYAQLFSQSLVEMGTETEDFVKLSQRIGRKTGGVSPSSFLSALRDDAEGAARLFVHGKAMVAQAPELLAILRDILLTVKLDNRERFRQIVLKSKANRESGLAPMGSAVVEARLRAKFHKTSWASEQMGGVSQLFFLRQLADAVEHDWPSVLSKLEQVRRLLVNRNALICNVTLDGDNWARFEPRLHEFIAELPAAAHEPSLWEPSMGSAHEGLTMPAQVNYVGKAASLYDVGYRLDGSIHVITNFLRTNWLWEKLRVQGGAYGAMCRFSQQSGVLCFLSYRDPNLLQTLDVYDETAGYLRNVELSDDELTKNIIGAIGALDAYQLPDAKGYTSMTRYLLGESDDRRQLMRDEVLSTSVSDFRAFADVLEAAGRQGRVVVLGSPEAVAAADAARGGWLRVEKVL